MIYIKPTGEIIPLQFEENIRPENGDKIVIVVNYIRHEFQTDKGSLFYALEFSDIDPIKSTINSISKSYTEICNLYTNGDQSLFNFKYNCHGWTFLGGKYRLERPCFIKTVLLDEFDLINEKEEYQEGDVIVYLKDESGKTLKSITDLNENVIIHSCKIINGQFSHKIGDKKDKKTYTERMGCKEEYRDIGSSLLCRKKR